MNSLQLYSPLYFRCQVVVGVFKRLLNVKDFLDGRLLTYQINIATFYDRKTLGI